MSFSKTFSLAASACAVAAALASSSHALAQACRNQAGAYKMFADCNVEGTLVNKDAPVRVTQSACSTVTLEATVTIPVAVPGNGGPYDMCAIAEFNCGLYGDSCDYANSEECRNRPPAPEPIVKNLKETVPYSAVSRDFSGRILTVGACRVYR